MIRNESPCLNCEERHDGCHSKCERYLSYRAELDRINEERFRESEHEGRLNAYHRETVRKVKRSRK